MEYRFITVAGMDYEIDIDDSDPDTLLALNNFTVSDEELEDKDLLKEIFLHQIVVLGLKRFMDIGEYIFKDTSVIAVAENLKENNTFETTMIEFDTDNTVLVGEDTEHAERKRAIISIPTKIRITFEKQALSEAYKLNVEQWTNDNDEDQDYDWHQLFWITVVEN